MNKRSELAFLPDSLDFVPLPIIESPVDDDVNHTTAQVITATTETQEMQLVEQKIFFFQYF